MNKWLLIKRGSIITTILTIIWIIINIIQCIKLDYPRDSLGVTVNNWFGEFSINLAFYGIIWGLLLIVSIILFIISNKKLKKDTVK